MLHTQISICTDMFYIPSCMLSLLKPVAFLILCRMFPSSYMGPNL